MNKYKVVLRILAVFLVIIVALPICASLFQGCKKKETVVAVYQEEGGPIVRFEVSTDSKKMTILPSNKKFKGLKNEIDDYYFEMSPTLRKVWEERKIESYIKKNIKKK